MTELAKLSASKRIKIFILARLALFLLRLLVATYRFRFNNPELFDQGRAFSPTGACVMAAWHCNLFAAATAHRGLPMNLMISPSFDGELITYVFKKFGFKAIRGSSSRGGAAALAESIGWVKQGGILGITPDGPKGPRFKAKPGALKAGLQNNVAIIPLQALPNRYWQFRSWDKFRLPKPFARITVTYAEPLIIPPEGERKELEWYRAELDRRLSAMEPEFFSQI